MKRLSLALGLLVFAGSFAFSVASSADATQTRGWYCKESPQRPTKWVRCSSSTGQCIPPDFDKKFQCENALP